MLVRGPGMLVVAAVLAAARGSAAEEPREPVVPSGAPSVSPLPARPPLVLPEPGPAPWGAPGVVRLHVDTMAPHLELRVFDGLEPLTGYRNSRRTISRWICTAPCDEIIDAREGARYFFGGPGLDRSPLFRLDGRSGLLAAHVEAGHASVKTAGKALTLLGPSLMGLGTVILVTGSAVFHPEDPDTRGEAAGFRIAGGVLLGLGVATLITGVTLLVRGSTHFAFSAPRVEADGAREEP